MIYIWQTPTKFNECMDGDELSKYIGVYNREKGPDHIMLNSGLWEGGLWNFSKNEIEFLFSATSLEVLRYDVLQNDYRFIIVNRRVKEVLESIASQDLQFVPITVKCTNGLVDGYYAVNILARVSGIDMENSIIEWGSPDDSPYIRGFGTGTGGLVYNHACMGSHQIALEKEFTFILISQKLKYALCSMNPPVNDVRFVLPEETEW
jgi:hypothetical protein